MAGKKISLSDKKSLGRSQADIQIDDSKLSGIHAFFEIVENKGWFVFDNQSRNGVWVNGHKEIKAQLKDGDSLLLGSNQIRCRILGGEQLFSQNIQQWVQRLLKKIKNKPVELLEIKPEIRLKMIQGIQYGEQWDIFYGPRHAGRDSLDICLFDDGAPKDSFEIHVKGKYAYFYTNNENRVKVNNKSVKTKQFSPGDVISFGESRIIVEFDEGHGFST